MPDWIGVHEFTIQMHRRLQEYKGKMRSVSGPGRSGAVASVYASYILGVPWIPITEIGGLPDRLAPILIIDTATRTGKTLRRAKKQANVEAVALALHPEPPRLRFWYERSEP